MKHDQKGNRVFISVTIPFNSIELLVPFVLSLCLFLSTTCRNLYAVYDGDYYLNCIDSGKNLFFPTHLPYIYCMGRICPAEFIRKRLEFPIRRINRILK